MTQRPSSFWGEHWGALLPCSRFHSRAAGTSSSGAVSSLFFIPSWVDGLFVSTVFTWSSSLFNLCCLFFSKFPPFSRGQETLREYSFIFGGRLCGERASRANVCASEVIHIKKNIYIYILYTHTHTTPLEKKCIESSLIFFFFSLHCHFTCLLYKFLTGGFFGCWLGVEVMEKQ